MKTKSDIELLSIIKENQNLPASIIAVLAGYKPSPKINSRIAKIAKDNNISLLSLRKHSNRNINICKVCLSLYDKINSEYWCWECCSQSCYLLHIENENKIPKTTLGKIKRIQKIRAESCIVCQHTSIIEVHHINCDKHDHRETNLVSLCANHHKMIHLSKFHDEIQQTVDEFMVNKFGVLYDGVSKTEKFYLFDNHDKKIKKRPPVSILEEQLINMTISDIARYYEVNNATVYKWIKYHSLKT